MKAYQIACIAVQIFAAGYLVATDNILGLIIFFGFWSVAWLVAYLTEKKEQN